MSFPAITSKMVPLLADVGDIPPDLDLLYERGCSFLRVPLCESEDGRWLLTVDVGYLEYSEECPCSGIRPMDYVMFGYEITLFDQVDTVVYQTMDPTVTKGVIPDECRQLVVDISCECYQRLIKNCLSDYIYRETYLLHPGTNALKKHAQATETLTQEGYSVVREGTDTEGRKFWLLGRSELDHSNLDNQTETSVGVAP